MHSDDVVSHQAEDCLLRIESLLEKQVKDQVARSAWLEQEIRNIRHMANWCALAALVYLGLMAYHYFFR